MHSNNRYSRQAVFPLIGEQGQQKLLDSTVLIVGCGALGSGSAELLARAGVGRLRIVDRDFVEIHNLQRQTLFDQRHVDGNLPKAVAAAQRIREINRDIRVEAEVADVTPDNVLELCEGADIVLDGTDNWSIRYLLNDISQKIRIPWIYAGVIGAISLTMPVVPGATPCLRCVYPEPPAPTGETCETAGVLGWAVWMTVSLQVASCVRILLGDPPEARLSTIDAWNGGIEHIPLALPNPDCPACKQHRWDFLDAEGQHSVRLCGRNSIQVAPGRGVEMDLESLAGQLRGIGTVRHNEYLLKLDVSEYELTVFGDGRAIIKGTEDESVARSLYAKYIGG